MKTNRTFPLWPCVAALVAQLAVASAFAADASGNPGQLAASDYQFARDAAIGGQFEVTLGNIASVNSKNPAVQQFGQRMVGDHGKAGQELQQIAQLKGATLPTQLPSPKQHEIDRLAKLTGTDFDKDYMACMVKAHKMDEKAFRKAAQDLQDPDLKAFAARTLTMVQAHLKMARDLEQSVKHELSVNNP